MQSNSRQRTISATAALILGLLALLVASVATVSTSQARAGAPVAPEVAESIERLGVSTSSVSVSKAGKATKPVIVLVHGAFADAAGWNDVSLELQDRGYDVHAWANPLRGLPTDAAYLRDYLSTVQGPVILVGHSYGGAVITEASAGNPNIEALVYIAAYALDEGENVAHANELGGGHSTVIENIDVRPYPGAPEGDGDAMVKVDKFRHIFAADLPRPLVRAMARSQRPAALSALVIPATEAGWKTIPSYFLVAENDNLIPTVAQVEMAQRAGATWRTVDSSHVVMQRRPGWTVRYIVRADAEN